MPKLGLIDNMNLDLTQAEKNSLRKVLGEGEQRSIDSVIDSIEEHFSRIEAVSEPIFQKDKTNSADFNKQFADFYSDLVVIYMASNKIDAIMTSENETINNEIEGMKDKLKNIKNKLDTLYIIAEDSNSFTRAFKENFENQRKFNQYNSNIFIDPKTNYRFSEDEICDFDPISQAITSSIESSFGDFKVDIEKIDQSGEGFIEYANNDNPPGNAISGNYNKVWNEIIESPHPFDINYNDHIYKNNESGDSFRNGAMCKLKIDVANGVPINTLKIDPFSEYPFEILKITAFPNEHMYNLFTDEGDYERAKQISNAYDILGPESYSQNNPLIVDGPKVINFQDVDDSSFIVILIRQRNYKLSSYNIENNEKENINSLKTIYENKDKIFNINNDENVDHVVELDYNNKFKRYLPFQDIIESLINNFEIGRDTVMNLINSLDRKLKGFNAQSLKRKFGVSNTEFNDRTLDINKYQYQYGMRNLDIEYNGYNNKSIFVSDIYESDSNIKEVALNVNDNITESGSIQDDYTIEYYISNLEDPSIEDWYPVLPESYKDIIHTDKGYIVSEVIQPLVGTNDIKGNLRFPADTDLKSDCSLLVNNDEEISFTFEDSNTIILDPNLDTENIRNKIFTLNYYIEDTVDPFIINFDEVATPYSFIGEDGIPGELFDRGTNKNQMVELSHHPYIDYEQINSSYVDPDKYDFNDIDADIADKLSNYSPNNYEYNPNYNINNDGYRPLVVEMEGEVICFDINTSGIENYKGNIFNDKYGMPFKFNYVNKIDGDYIPEVITREEQLNQNGLMIPYFYNKTDYLKDESRPVNNYDPVENPVFEYIQHGKKLFFNDSFNKTGTDNRGRIRVHYDYLVQGVRLMAIMKKKVFNKDITPVLYDYYLKTRSFR